MEPLGSEGVKETRVKNLNTKYRKDHRNLSDGFDIITIYDLTKNSNLNKTFIIYA